MSGSKFTPGPWLVVHDGWQPWDGAIEIQASRSAQNPYTTIAWTPTGGDEVANALLIAAAPELLECLKDARRLLTDQDAIDLAHIDEVIAKAEGTVSRAETAAEVAS